MLQNAKLITVHSWGKAGPDQALVSVDVTLYFRWNLLN
jgi:hypothetical protein